MFGVFLFSLSVTVNQSFHLLGLYQYLFGDNIAVPTFTPQLLKILGFALHIPLTTIKIVSAAIDKMYIEIMWQAVYWNLKRRF